MKLLSRAFGPYHTNCYFLEFDTHFIAIDPGDGAFAWIDSMLDSRPLSILLTHGHFDHIYDMPKLAKKYNADVYCPVDDNFMLKSDCFSTGITPYQDAIEIPRSPHKVRIFNTTFIYNRYPGHTPGCSMIELEKAGVIFSGDFIFKGSIGRYDFPYSSREDMKKSLLKFTALERNDAILLPGHGDKTSLHAEIENIKILLKSFR